MTDLPTASPQPSDDADKAAAAQAVANGEAAAEAAAPHASAPRAPTRITLIGTGHVFDIGARVRHEIRRREPGAVAIELDRARYQALRSKNKDKTGVPLVYRLLAEFQTRLADKYGVEAGDEMLAAADEAAALAVPLALVDRDARVTFQRLRQEMPAIEKLRFVGSAVVGILPWYPGQKSIEKQLDDMQDDYAKVFEMMGDRLPTLKRVLLDERNEYMANHLAQMASHHARLVAVVGDGHVDGMQAILQRRDDIIVETVRLKELRTGPAVESGEGTASASFAVEIADEAGPPRE